MNEEDSESNEGEEPEPETDENDQPVGGSKSDSGKPENSTFGMPSGASTDGEVEAPEEQEIDPSQLESRTELLPKKLSSNQAGDEAEASEESGERAEADRADETDTGADQPETEADGSRAAENSEQDSDLDSQALEEDAVYEPNRDQPEPQAQDGESTGNTDAELPDQIQIQDGFPASPEESDADPVSENEQPLDESDLKSQKPETSCMSLRTFFYF